MLFSSNVFLYFYLPAVLVLYYLTPRKLRNLTLFVVSLVFYGWGEPVYVLLMLGTILLNYASGRAIEWQRGKGGSGKPALVFGVVANLLILGFFKYAAFIMESLQQLIPALEAVKVPQIALPIGISFYVFQSMSYIIDVYRSDAQVQRDPVAFGTYVTLFPQLIAGPIVRYSDVEKQLSGRRERLDVIASGVRLFVVGLAKKVLLANQMGAMWLALQEQPGTLAAWTGVAAYTLQIYFDFSGYSDMARGLGRMMGFEFLINFDYPYISSTVTEFWRRWHISLSTWFREYVYIPLGGNHKGLPRQILNLLVVWVLTGLWHGANWNFLLWGLYYGVILIIEKTVLLRVLKKAPRFIGHIYTLLAVMLGWVLFCFEDTAALCGFFGRLFVPAAESVSALNTVLAYMPLFAAAVVAATPLGALCYGKIKDRAWGRAAGVAAVAVLMVLSVAALISQSYNPFIYFRF